MKIVMLEPLMVREEVFMKAARPLLSAGHEILFCEHPLTEDEKIRRAEDADVLIIANSPLKSNIIEAAKKVKMISVGFTGVDHIDLATCRERGIVVCNAHGYATDSTAELTIALMLSCLRNLPSYDLAVRQGKTAAGYISHTLRNKTVGIIGTGAIGRRVAELVMAFGGNVLGYSPRENRAGIEMGIRYETIEKVFAESDLVTLHAPLTGETKGMIGKELIAAMKETAIFINCARGGLVDSQALADALNEGKIAGAGIDVYEMEPPIPAEHPLLNAKHVVLAPHIGFISEESYQIRVDIVCQNIMSWLAGEPVNVKA